LLPHQTKPLMRWCERPLNFSPTRHAIYNGGVPRVMSLIEKRALAVKIKTRADSAERVKKGFEGGQRVKELLPFTPLPALLRLQFRCYPSCFRRCER